MSEEDLERRCRPQGNAKQDLKEIFEELVIPLYSIRIVVKTFRNETDLTRREAMYGCFLLESCKTTGYVYLAMLIYDCMT